MRHDEPFEKTDGCAEHDEGDGVLIGGDLVERGYQVEQEEDASFSQGIEDIVDAVDGELSEGADCVNLLVVGRNPDVAVFLRNRYHRAGVRGDRMLDEASGQVLVEYGVGLFDKDGVDAVWTGSEGCTIRRNGNLEQDEGAGAKVGFRCGENVREFSKDVAQSVDDRRGPTGAMEVKRDVA